MAQLQSDEGKRLVVYDDANGKPVLPGYTLIGHPTIGTGRALDTNGITDDEAFSLLSDDVTQITIALTPRPWFPLTPSPRRDVLIMMAFNMGVAGLLEFQDMLSDFAAGNFQAASAEMMASHWAQELPDRAERLAEIMRNGVY